MSNIVTVPDATLWAVPSKTPTPRAFGASKPAGIVTPPIVLDEISLSSQGPCVGNQLTLAHSRLWDAVGGFLFIFAHMQDKLSRDPEQLELLRQFMNLQKEMMIMLLSMLEGKGAWLWYLCPESIEDVFLVNWLIKCENV